MNQKVIMSNAKFFSNLETINPYYTNEPIDREKAIKEHQNLKSILIKNGIKVLSVPSPVGCQDGVYTANWALIRGNKAVLSNLPTARKNEESLAKEILENLGKKVLKLPNNLKFSGQGDALACGNLLFCGSNYRSDKQAQALAADYLGYKLIQLETIPQTDANNQPIINPSTGWPDSFFYDIDLALAILKQPTKDQKGLIAYCPDAFTIESQKLISEINEVDKIEISLAEAKTGFAANLISTGETVIMSANAPDLASTIKKYGLKVICPEITELAKGGGYIRCMTLTID